VRPAVGVAAVHRHRCGANHAGTCVYTLTASVRSRKANRPRLWLLSTAPQGRNLPLLRLLSTAPQGRNRPRRRANHPRRRPLPPLPALPALDARAARRIDRIAGRCRPCPRLKANRPRRKANRPLHRLLSTAPHGRNRPRRKANHPRRQASGPRRRPLPPLPALPALDARAARRIAIDAGHRRPCPRFRPSKPAP